MLIPSSVRGRRENVRAAQTELKKSLIRSVISLLVNSRLPASQLIDFLWLISSRATFAANVDGFVGLEHPRAFVADWAALRDWLAGLRDVSLLQQHWYS